jgi:3-hydroxyisobutyrate dehydrogenase
MATAMGLPLPIVEMTLRNYRQLMDDGHGEEDISALYRLKGQQD